MIAGTLEIQLLANMARLTADMNQAKTMVSGTMRDISRAVDEAKSALAGLGLSLTAGGLALIAKNAIDAADSMNDLSKSTGVAVEKLAGLRFAAKQSGGDLEGIAASINKLSVNIGKNAEKFAALGVTSKDPLEAFKQLADVFKDIDDPQLRAAMGAEALGKQWASAAPLLAEGSKKIGEMVEKGEKLSGMTKEIAKGADDFNDKLAELAGNGGTVNGMLAQMLPLLNKVLDDFISLKGEGGGLGQVLGGALTEALRAVVILGGNVGFVLRGIGTEIGGLAAQAAAVAVGDFKRAAEIGRMMTADAEASRAKFDAWEKSIMAVGTAAGKTATATAGMSEEDLEAARIAKDAADAANKKARAFLAGADAAGKLAKAQKDLGLADAHVVAFLKMEAELRESVAKALAAGEEKRRRYIDAIEDEIKREEWANDTLGMTREQIALLVVARLEERMAILKASGAMETELAQLQEEIDLRKRLADSVGRGESGRAAIEAQSAALRDQASVWGEISRTAGDFFADLVMNGKDAFENLRNYAKRFLAELISIFAQRWVLQMAVGATGSTALSALAGQTGSGTAAGSLAGSLLSAGGGLLQSGLGTLLGGGTGGAVAASELMGMLSGAGPYIAAIAGVYALYQAFKDKGENWKGKLGFGANANAYSTTGPFGAQGFEYLAGNDAQNRAIQASMGSTIGIDRQLAGRLTPQQIAAITGRLGGAYSTRADGQPAEFAFGKDDTTAAEQLTSEFLKKKYGTIFDTLDATFAEFIRGYTGTAADLMKEIATFAGLLDALDATGIKGLNIETLRAFQKEGEDLGQTFARVTQQWSDYQSAFLTDAEKVALVQDQVSEVFAALGVAIPASNEEFRNLVDSLDLSTESGRKMFTALMGVAPAFNTITNAAAAAVTRFNSLAATLSPSFGASNARSVLESRVRTWMGLNPANGEAGGWNVENTIDNIGRLVREGRIGEALTYAQSLGGNAVTVLNDMLEAYIAWTNAMQNAQGPVIGVATGITGLGDAATRAAEQMVSAKDGLWAYLQGLLVNPSMSPLDPMQQLDLAKRQFYEQLALAQGGDLGAASGLQGYIERVLGLGRGAFASGSGYVSLFREITEAAANFARPGGAGDLQKDMYAETRTGNDILRDVRQILLDIRDKGTADGDNVAGAVASASLETARR